MAVRLPRVSRTSLCLLLLMLAACGPASEPKGSAGSGNETVAAPAPPAANQSSAPLSTPTGNQVASLPESAPVACAAEIGAAAAARRVEVCRNVSPATHPPCNIANSCAMIEEEIARSCALFDGPPMADCQPAPKSMQAAAAVVQRYYSALNARDYDTAWRQWGETGPAGQTQAQFKAGFARTRSTRVTIGALEPGDAAAGSIYQPVPVTVDATLDDGTRQQFRGTYILRRVNDVDGATPDQLRWHIASAKLTARAAR